MADTTTTYELLVTTFATADALAKLLIEKGLITQAEFMEKLSVERGNVSKTFQPHAAMSAAPFSPVPTASLGFRRRTMLWTRFID
jgi:hypothetical protein